MDRKPAPSKTFVTLLPIRWNFFLFIRESTAGQWRIIEGTENTLPFRPYQNGEKTVVFLRILVKLGQ